MSLVPAPAATTLGHRCGQPSEMYVLPGSGATSARPPAWEIPGSPAWRTGHPACVESCDGIPSEDSTIMREPARCGPGRGTTRDGTEITEKLNIDTARVSTTRYPANLAAND